MKKGVVISIVAFIIGSGLGLLFGLWYLDADDWQYDKHTGWTKYKSQINIKYKKDE